MVEQYGPLRLYIRRCGLLVFNFLVLGVQLAVHTASQKILTIIYT